MKSARQYRPFASILITCAAAATVWLVLTSVSTALEPPVQLSGPCHPSASVKIARISPDGKYVVYVQDAEIDDAFRVYSVPISGGSPTALTPNPKTNGAVPSFAISPDSMRVVINGIYSAASRTDLYGVPINGPATALTSLATEAQHGFLITPSHTERRSRGFGWCRGIRICPKHREGLGGP